MLIINKNKTPNGKTLSISFRGNIKPERNKTDNRPEIIIRGKPGEEPSSIRDDVHRADESEIDSIFQSKNFEGIEKVIIRSAKRGGFNLNGHAGYLIGKIQTHIPKGIEVHIINLESLSQHLGEKFISTGKKPR